MFEIKTGDVLRMKKWEHTEGTTTVNYGYPRSTKPKRVAVFLYLGEELSDGTKPLDGEAVLNRLGWFKEKKKND